MGGQAARVGETTIAATDIQERSQEVLAAAATVEANPIDTTALNRAQVGTWVRERLSDLAAERADITITDGQIDRFLSQVVTSNGTSMEQLELAIALQEDFWIPPTHLDAYVKSFLQQQAIAQKVAPNGSDQEQAAAVATALSQVGDDVGVEVSPRYGTWDPLLGTVSAPADDLSTPAPAATVAAPDAFLNTPSAG